MEDSTCSHVYQAWSSLKSRRLLPLVLNQTFLDDIFPQIGFSRSRRTMPEVDLHRQDAESRPKRDGKESPTSSLSAELLYSILELVSCESLITTQELMRYRLLTPLRIRYLLSLLQTKGFIARREDYSIAINCSM